MNKFFFIPVMLLMLMPDLYLQAQVTISQSKDKDIVEVYYFHLTRRCMSCKTVEAETEKAINEYFPEKVKDGTIIYKVLNLEEGDNEKVAESLGVSGQTLLVKHGDKQADITNKAFMNTSNPERLRKQVKAGIESVL
ncbi:MAG: hypothetical protein IH598_09470 [Bacteroidales bacterium]|nr:hypothetical protein [Bacteroidales bacterium]